ncbi:hypothetical protein E2L06_03170 [Haloterrigena sp. H1]|uniref:hypothetical protein n=1 Tax=Haloterrigena sp. H1 TaxID=2552943 RepID=UPI00110E5623|nr:hypothetical protein [Haloterrigena sp. H1]TMT85647.1 hypothetical protein E2L06_03170 [Haloterrigena sp. H1]
MIAIVGVATIGLPVAFGGATTTVEAAEPSPEFKSYDSVAQVDSQSEPADDIYLGDNGSAVLHYEDDSGDLNKIDMGMDVSEGLVHVLVVDDIEDPDEELESANFSAVLDQQGLSGSGSMVMQQPDDLEQLDVDVTGEVTEDANEFDAEMSGTFTSESASTESVSTNGEISATADRFETSGEVSAETETDDMAAETDRYFDATLKETSNGYTIDVTQEQLVSEWSASQWETREQAKKTLQGQYGTVAMSLGGTSDIEVTNYDFQNESAGQSQLTLEYTVTYTGIDSGLEEQLTEQLTADQSSDLTRSEAETIATSVTAVDLEKISFMMDESEGSTTAEWDVAIANYDELTFAMFDLMEASDTSGQLPEDQLEKARTAIEAQQAADLESTITWDGSVEQTSSGEASFDATVTGDTKNWDAYIDELESRDIEPPNDVTFDLTAETDGDKLSMDGEFELETKELAGQTINRWAESIKNSQSSPTMSSETEEFVSALEDSKLEVARIDAGIKEGTVRVEAGARFENMSAITDTVSDSMSISGVATEQTNETTSMYVYVDDMDGIDTASATKSDIEHLSVVGPETTVHEAGEWDEEFPEVDTDSMSEYLEQSNGESGSKTTDSDDMPGFGIGAGLTALAALLTTLVLRRRP